MALKLRPKWEELRILDIDIETRKIGFHTGGRFSPDGAEPVIIAFAFEGEDVETFGLRPTWRLGDVRRMLEAFSKAYAEADVITGHYIRKFDLPILNGALFEHGMNLLEQRLVIDTKSDLVNMAALSKSQENLSALLDLEASKFHMNDNWWRKVARLQPEGLELAKTRVICDVLQHQQLRAQLAADGALKPPSLWKP